MDCKHSLILMRWNTRQIQKIASGFCYWYCWKYFITEHQRKNTQSEEEQRRRKKLQPQESDEELDYQIAKFVGLLQHSLFQDCYNKVRFYGIVE